MLRLSNFVYFVTAPTVTSSEVRGLLANLISFSLIVIFLINNNCFHGERRADGILLFSLIIARGFNKTVILLCSSQAVKALSLI